MRTIKLCAIIICALSFQLSNSQEAKPQMLWIHQDDVKFSKMVDYEKVTKEFTEAFKTNNVTGTQWTAASLSDGRYLYITPIESMADLDSDGMGNAAEKLGKDTMSKMIGEMNKCYDSHSDFIVHHVPSLSYNPENAPSMEGKNAREWHFLYYTPSTKKAVSDGIKSVKKLFTDKGSKAPFNVYESGFGQSENYYVVVIAGEDRMDIAKTGKENDAILGDERKAVFLKMIEQVRRYDYAEGEIRPDLSFAPKN